MDINTAAILDASALYDWRVLTLAGAVAIPTLTYFITSLKFANAKARAAKGNCDVEPPLVPYSIPLVGHTFSFIFNTPAYLASLQRRYGENPLRLAVAGMKMYFIPHGDMIQAMSKNSRQLHKKALGVLLRRHFGMSQMDLECWLADDSGMYPKPAEGYENMDPHARVWYIAHRDFQTLLTGEPLNAVTTKFIEVLRRRLTNHELARDQWTEIPDLITFLNEEMLAATIEVLCGAGIFEASPDIVKNFYSFDDAFPKIVRRVPRFIARSAYDMRDRLVEDVKRWHRWAAARFDWEDEAAVEADWEPIYGAKLMRARARMMHNTNMSADGKASLDLSFIWAANANVIPVTSWSVLDIIRTDGLLERVLSEIDSCFGKTSLDLDFSKVCNVPLLTSIYMEELRLRAALTMTRQALADDFRIGNWVFEKDVSMFATPWLGGQDADFWNGGRDEEHPATGFWAERFLEYPDDPYSGPIRTHRQTLPTSKKGQSSPAARVGEKNSPKTSDDDKLAKVVTAGMQGHYFPYGSGVKICPGRFLAKQEMMVGTALILRVLEIELADPVATKRIGPDMSRFPTGTLQPNATVPCRIRRRNID